MELELSKNGEWVDGGGLNCCWAVERKDTARYFKDQHNISVHQLGPTNKTDHTMIAYCKGETTDKNPEENWNWISARDGVEPDWEK